MIERFVLSGVLMLLSMIPVGFLVYTLLNLKRRGIPVTHPRVIVETIIFIILLLSGVYLRRST
ncbi:MAG TPA: hypothetical protein VM050_07065 [Patescibacteria group bacterium]|nr:hypothetical protein [Patescibacteria group bacterium]